MIPHHSKKISPFDDGDPEYDFGVFGFDQYDALPERNGVPWAKGPVSHEHLKILAQTSRTFENHLRFLSSPSQLNRPVSDLKAMLFQISGMTSEKSTTLYNAFVHEYRKSSQAKGDTFVQEATDAYNHLKGEFVDDAVGWKRKCEDLVRAYDNEKKDNLSAANEWNEGHAGLMKLTMDKMASEV